MKLKVLVLAVATFSLSGCYSILTHTHYAMGTQARLKGNTAEAERMFQIGCERGELRDRGAACNDLGVIYAQSGRRDAAINAYQWGARYGNMTAVQNLNASGAAVPPADLLPYVIRNNAANDAAFAAAITNGMAGIASTAARPAPQTVIVEKSRPTPAPSPRNCTSTVNGTVINTWCN